MFKYCVCELEIVDKNKYLGIALNEHLEYYMIPLILANSAGRALLAIYNKYKLNKGFVYDICTTLYHSCSIYIRLLDHCMFFV